MEPISRRRAELSEIVHLAPIKPGLVPSHECAEGGRPISYADRLKLVLEAFNAREEQGFPSVIRLFRGIHAASWALLDGDTRLLLHVTFDGDWHHYLRALVLEVPGFLELIWGNCVGWQRLDGKPERLYEFIQTYQVRANFLYVHHPELNVRDVDWLKQLRKQVDQPAPSQPTSPLELYRRVAEAQVPRSSAQRLADALREYDDVEPGAVERGKWAFEALLGPLYAKRDVERACTEAFGAGAMVGAPQPAALTELEVEPQGNIVAPYRHAYCARVFFVHFPEQARVAAGSRQTPAQAWLAAVCAQLEHGNIGFTPDGLRALGVPEAEMGELPDAFCQGMRARASVLGDPQGRLSPALPDGTLGALEGESLHAVLIAYRLDPPDPVSAACAGIVNQLEQVGKQVRDPSAGSVTYADLSRELAAALDASTQPLRSAWDECKARILGTQDLHHPLIERKNIEYFGFRDGIRQAIQLDAEGKPRDPASLRRALLIGERALLRDGSYLVMRQLEQHTQAFWAHMERERAKLGLASARAAAELAMGRRMDGIPLGGGAEEDPAFSLGEDGAVCPFHAHTRRVNLQVDPQPELNPGLIRRSMSYATEQARGLMFMAFNADLASQFEFIQRNWVQSGSHVGQTSDQRDPVVGLKPAGARAEPARVDLPAFVTLRWGAYFFVPGRKALALLAGGGSAQASESVAEALGCAARLAPLLASGQLADAQALVRGWLDAPESASQFWCEVERGRIRRLGGWVFVARPEHVRAIMSDASGRYSVAGYGQRMASTSGKFFLGMDKGPEYDREHVAVAILPRGAQVTHVERAAYAATRAFVQVLRDGAALSSLTEGGPVRVASLDLQVLMAVVLNEVWTETLGLSGPGAGSLLLWGRDITSWLFRVAASAADRAKAAEAACDFRQHVLGLLASVDAGALSAALAAPASKLEPYERILAAAQPRADDEPPARAQRTLAATVLELCRALGASSATDDVVVRNFLNIVTGSLGATTRLFLDGFEVFRQGRAAAREELVPALDPLRLGRPLAPDALYERLIMAGLAMRRRAGPDSLYRVFRGVGTALPELAELEATLTPGDTLVVWLGGMLNLRPERHDYAFGAGFRSCPGMDMGKAIINGVLLALFQLPGLSATAPGVVHFASAPVPPPLS